jgi:hypothetical protein
MPNEELKAGWTQPLVEGARKILNGMLGTVPGCLSNDAKYGIDFGDLVYSEKELLRIASGSRDFADRAELVTNYLAQCNPKMEKPISQMNKVTKRLFYNELSDDRQFNWCLEKYPGIELGAKYMKPGTRGVHIADSVTRNNFRKKYITSPLGSILIFLLHMGTKGNPGELSQRALMAGQPALDPSRVPVMDSGFLAGLGGGANLLFNQFLYGTYDSFDSYAIQRAEEQAESTAGLLRRRVDEVLQQHKNVRMSSHGKHLVKCVSIDPDDSPTVDTSSKMHSESLMKIRSGQTGCTSVCGTQHKVAVDKCLSLTHTPSFSFDDNQYCESLGQFKSEEALRSDYMAEARQGVFNHEKTWRQDQRIENAGECREPMVANFNPYPGTEIDKRDYFNGASGAFISDGVDFKKGCRLTGLPSVHTEFQNEPQESFVCKDDQSDQRTILYTPDIQSIESGELIIGLKKLLRLRGD